MVADWSAVCLQWRVVGAELVGRGGGWPVGSAVKREKAAAGAVLGEAKFRFGPSIYDCSNCTLN